MYKRVACGPSALGAKRGDTQRRDHRAGVRCALTGVLAAWLAAFWQALADGQKVPMCTGCRRASVVRRIIVGCSALFELVSDCNNRQTGYHGVLFP